MSIYIVPPLVTIYFWVCLSVIILKGKSGSERYYFVPITFFWTLTSLAYILHFILRFTSNNLPANIELSERIVHAIYAHGPFVHFWVINRIMRIESKKSSTIIFLLGLLFSVIAFTDYYIIGVNNYNWGYICKGNYFVFLFLGFVFSVVLYCFKLISENIKKEDNSIARQKIVYFFVSLIIASILISGNLLPIFGYNIFPPGNFAVFPIAIFAYGVLNYRILELGELMNRMCFWIVVGLLIIIPNFAIFTALSPVFVNLDSRLFFAVLALWFYISHKFVLFIFPVVRTMFNKQQYNLRKVEAGFIENILFLRNIEALSEEFTDMFTEILGFKSAELYSSSVEECIFINSRGKQITIDAEIIRWFVNNNHLLDYNMVATNPSYDDSRNGLMRFMESNNCNYIVPVIWQKKMTGIVFLTEKKQYGELTEHEVKFINNIREFVAIAILNSLLFQNVSLLKDELEKKTILLEQEIVERNNTQKVLTESEARYRLLADNVFDVIWVLEIDSYNFSYFSPSIKTQLGYHPEELTGKGAARILTGESYKNVIVAMEKAAQDDRFTKAKSLIIELEAIHKNGEKLWIEISAHFIRGNIKGKEDKPVKVIGVSRNISERKKAEADREHLENKLRQAQKMESIGALAGGIAHDFNNILMAILGYTQLVDLYIEQEQYSKASKRIAEVEKACQRAQEMVSRILTFSRQTDQKKSRVRIKSVVEEALSLLKISLPSSIEIIKALDDGDGVVNADAVQIHQIVLNLCTNASHAMEETGGELRVSLGFKNLDETAGRNLCLSSGLYCVLTIEDTGHGMDSRTAQRIFDPYFTTKEIGKGTGMGLSVVHGIVLNHEGAISVESKENEGTKFQIYLPGEFEEEKTKTVENKKSERLLSEKWRILFVDDEEVLCELAEEALSNAGYLIQTVSSSREALELFQQTPDAFDVVITDLTMPEITGDILISRIKEIRKDIKVILCTGYNYNLSDTMREKINVDMYLVKPLSISDIDEAVMDVLRQGR